MGEVHGVDSCYLYIVRNEETIRSGFGDVGVGIGESIGLECFGKSKYPVQNDGCYKVMWNGVGSEIPDGINLYMSCMVLFCLHWLVKYR